MPARLIAHLPDHAAAARTLHAGDVVCVGRGEGCDLRLAHPSVSRRHAELRWEAGQWRLRDLDSKNGTRVDGCAVAEESLRDGAWLRFGDVYCEFGVLSDSQAEAGEQRLRDKRLRATALTMGLQPITGFGDLLDGSLQAVIELAHCSRGFVLLRDGDDYLVRAHQALDPSQLQRREFSGSAGALQRAMQERRAVVINDIGSEPWASTRASVVAGGLRSLVCLPLLDGDVPLGAIYADRREAGEVIDMLDLELLQAFAERAALYIVAHRANDVLGARDAPRWPVAAQAPVA